MGHRDDATAALKRSTELAEQTNDEFILNENKKLVIEWGIK